MTVSLTVAADLTCTGTPTGVEVIHFTNAIDAKKGGKDNHFKLIKRGFHHKRASSTTGRTTVSWWRAGT